MNKRLCVLALGTIAGLSVVACGGGGGTSAPPGPAPNPSSSGSSSNPGGSGAAVAPASFKITIPSSGSSGSSARRSPRSIAANTQSVTFTLQQSTASGAPIGAVEGPYALTPSSQGCATVSAGLQCTISVNATIGTDVYTVNTYSTTNAAAGTQNGSGAFSIVVQANQANTASLTLSGTVASVLLSTNIPSPAYAPPLYAYGPTLGLPGSTGYPTSGRLYAIALDSSGNTILAPETYNTPVYVSLLSSSVLNTTPSSVGRRPLSPNLGTIYGQVSVTYAASDGGSEAGTTATTSGSSETLPIYSPQDVITVKTLASDAYTSTYIGEYIFAYASIGSTPPATLSSLGTNGVQIAIVPNSASPAPSPSPVPSASPVPSPSPSPAITPPPSTIAFAGITISTTSASAPNPAFAGLGPAVGTYTSNIVAASLDLGSTNGTVPFGIYLTDSGTLTTPYFTVDPSVCVNAGVITLPSSGVTLTAANYYEFTFTDNVTNGSTAQGSCDIYFTDSLGSQAVLEVFANTNTVTISGRGRKK